MLDLFNVLGCSDLFGTSVPEPILNIVKYLYLGIQVIVPILLILFGMIDLAKAITSQKEDEIKKAQSGLLKKAIVAVVVFLVFSLTKFIVKFAAGETKGNDIWSCVEEFMDGKESSSDVNGDH